ncbi:MAG: 5'/3'-nucleotidase SurE [Dysgonamonadaceae bacterium]|nr:5'/3'-nucleotidase SurE [Dysgonamonadaceae bacterium]
MEKKKPLILITNDDGYQAKGIVSLTEALEGLGEIVVFAPDDHRSGMSSAIGASHPVRCSLNKQDEDIRYYTCNGTPVDCVKLALDQILERKPDLVVSGINHGSNAGISVIYSGTMGAAIEGCIANIPSFGISLDDFVPDADFSQCARVARRVAEKILYGEGLPNGVCLNINVPKGEVKGLRVAKQTAGKWVNEYEKKTDEAGGDVYYMTGNLENWEKENDSTDEWALANGYAAVVPIKIDMTAYGYMDELKERLLK